MRGWFKKELCHICQIQRLGIQNKCGICKDCQAKIEAENKAKDAERTLECLICHEKFRRINANHLKYKHSISVQDYLLMFKDAIITTDLSRQKISLSLKGISKTFTEEHKANMKKGSKHHSQKSFIFKTYGEVEGIKVWDQYCNDHLRGENHPQFGLTGELATAYGRVHSEISKLKMSDARLNYLSTHHNVSISKPELEVKEILKSMNINFKQQYRLENKCYDFYLVDYNILIELDGCYWHARYENCRPKRWKEIIDNDEYKNQLAKKHQYRLIRIWDNEIYKEWRIILI